MYLELIKEENIYPLSDYYLSKLITAIKEDYTAGLLEDHIILKENYYALAELPILFEYEISIIDKVKYCTLYPIVNDCLDRYNYLKYKIVVVE
jgi:hypothetical protein